MKLLNLQKTHLPGKSLLLLFTLLLGLIQLNGFGQTTQCKADFSFEIDHESMLVKFKAGSSHSPVVFGWELSDGSTNRGEEIKHQFAAPGTYKVCLTAIAFNASTNQRCTTQVCKAVEIVDCDRLKADFRFEISGLSVRVKGESNSNHAVYGFSFGDGFSERGQSASHTYSKPGVYAVCFYAVDTIYGCKIEVCKRLLVDPCDLRAKFEYRQDGNDFKFYAKANDSDARFIWDFGDGSTAYGDEVKHTYQRPGVYTVCLKVISKNSDVICDFKTCERVEIPDSGCDLEAGFEYRQEEKNFKFFAKSSEDTARYVWDFGDGTTGYGQAIRHSYDKPGVYEVCLTVYAKSANSTGVCKVRICKRVVVERPDDPCNLRADFEYRLEGKKLYVIAKSNQDSVHYFWSFGDMHDASGKEARHRYDTYGRYEICLIVFNPRTKCKVCICKTIVIEKPCNLKADFKWKSNSQVIHFKARSNGSSRTNYYWDFGDGSRGEGQKTRHSYAKRGVYEVTLLVVDPASHCRVSVRYKVYVGVRPQQLTEDQNEKTENTEATLDGEEPNRQSTAWTASVNPSPARTEVAISSADKDLERVKIYSADGALALEATSNLGNVDISALPKGFYYAHVYATDGTLTIVKFLKE